MLTVCTRTHPGNVRTINEDSSMWEPDISTLAVADGMGGHNAGEVASQLALDTMRSFLKKSASGDDFTWPFGFSPTLSFAANRLMTAIKVANRRVFRASEERAEYTGMGTTVVALVVEGARIAFAGVGDSRIYSFDGAALTQITKDDSWVVMLMKESGLDASAFEKHPMRHVLTSVVGARPELDVTVEEMDLVDGPANRDIMVQSSNVRVVVDPKSALFVSGSLLDYSDDLQKGGFKVTNPNAVAHCSCGESFAA